MLSVVARGALASLAIALLTWCPASLAASATGDDIAAIRSAVFDYFEGINEVDPTRLQRAFADSAALKSVNESGELVVEPIAAAIARWLQAEPRERRGKIMSIDIAGEQIARVVFDYDGVYVDFLTLAKLSGQWQIIDKVFIPK